MASTRRFVVLAGLSGIFGQIALGIYFSGALIPSSLIPANATAAQMVSIASSHRDVIVLDAWLQAVGALGSVLYFLALVHLSQAKSRFAGLVTIVASALLVVVALMDATFALAAVQAAVIGHTQTTQVAFDFVAGAGEVFDYAFLFGPAPLVIISLGAVLRWSRILPRVFAYLAFVLGGGFILLGLASLVSPLSGPAGDVFEVIEVLQTVWVIASAAVLISRRGRLSTMDPRSSEP